LRLYQAEAARWEGFELGEVVVQHATEPERPLVVSYPVRVPHYAAVTQTRLVFPLAFFQQGVPPVFTAATREHVVYLPFESTEDDSVEVILPPGFTLEDAEAPAAFALPPAVEYRTSLDPSAERDRLVFRRSVSHGGMFYPTTTYRLLKEAFDDLHRRDGHVVIARRMDTAARRAETPVP
jgi:hypothetical protein